MIKFYRFFSGFDDNLLYFIEFYGVLIYIVLFLAIYLKTAFVLLTFIPGDSLVFASGALAATGKLNPWLLCVLFFISTVAGDSQNFSIGSCMRKWGNEQHKWIFLSDKNLQSAQKFLSLYGPPSIMYARFVPLMRTTVPFVCGLTRFPFMTFFKLNSYGAIFWVLFWINIGYILGNIKWVETHLVISLCIISLIPLIAPLLFFTVNSIKKANNKD